MSDATASEPLLDMRGICKAFPGVRALDRVDFEVRPGEVHALMGENGAGKSTLIKVLTGVHQPDAGTIRLQGDPITPQAPSEAEAAGISTVYQEVHLVPNLSVAENLMLGRQPTRAGLLSWKATIRRARAALERIDLKVDLHRELSACSTAVQQLVAIARAVDLNAKLLVLDEPTSSLDESEVADLFKIVDRLRQQGMGIVFVTHFLDQVYQISDRITVLRNGQRVGTYPVRELPRLELVSKMLGKEADEVAKLESQGSARKEAAHHGEVVLEAKGLSRTGSVETFDMKVRAGESLGLAGLLGSGRTEVLRLLYGLDRATTGTIQIEGKPLENPAPRNAIAAGLAFSPEDRKEEGVLLDLSVRENILLAMQASRGLTGALPLKRQQELTEHYIQALGIKTPSSETPVKNLSGGNQQKVLLARWLAMEPKLLMLDEPTRGIDVGAKAEIEALIRSLTAEGKALLFVSSELDEVVRCCQRVLVMRDRRQIGEFSGEEISEDRIIDLIAQHHEAVE
ncbi:MAG: sugar ABC transporter ATP-binding protein [Lacipirellulaceae bacterium]